MNTTNKITPQAIVEAQRNFAERLIVSDELKYVSGTNVPYNTRIHAFNKEATVSPFLESTMHLWDKSFATLASGDEVIVFRYFVDAAAEEPFALFIAYHEPGTLIENIAFHQFYTHEMMTPYVTTLMGSAYNAVIEIMRRARARVGEAVYSSVKDK